MSKLSFPNTFSDQKQKASTSLPLRIFRDPTPTTNMVQGLHRHSSPLAWWLPAHSETVPRDHQEATSCPRRLTSTLRLNLARFTSLPSLACPSLTPPQGSLFPPRFHFGTLHPFVSSLFLLVSSLNSFTWPSRPFFLSQPQSPSLPSTHYPISSRIKLLEVLKIPQYSPAPPGLQGFSFFWNTLSLFPQTSPFRLPVANFCLAFSSQLIWETFLMAEDLVRDLLTCSMAFQSSPLSEPLSNITAIGYVLIHPTPNNKFPDSRCWFTTVHLALITVPSPH